MNQKNCASCNFNDVNEMTDEWYCKADHREIRLPARKRRPNWCPRVKEADKKSKEKILSTLISGELSTYTSLYAMDRAVISISNMLALNEGMTKHAAKKALKALISEGLVEYTSQGCPAIVSYGEYPELIEEARPPINGYTLAKRAFETEEWKSAYAEWCRSMEEWANAPMEEDNPQKEDGE